MGIVGRVIAPGLVVSVHTVPPGGGEIGRSQMIPAGTWSEGDGYVRNMTAIEVRATGAGTPRFFGAWVDGRLRGSGPIHRTGYLVPGDVATIGRGEIVVRWPS